MSSDLDDQFPDGTGLSAGGYSSSLINRLKGSKPTEGQQHRRVRFDVGGLTGSAARQQGTLSGDSEEEHAPKEGGLLDWFSGGDSGGPTTSTAAASRPAGRQDQHLSSSDSLRTSKQARQRPQEDLQKDVSASIPSGVYSLERELEHLRKEISTLRYEKSEDLRSISELRGRIDVATEVHQRTISNMQEQHRNEVNELNRRHERELDDLKRSSERSQEILNNVKQHEASFDGIHTRIESLGHTLGNIAEKLKSFAKRDEDVEKILKLAKEQQIEHFLRIDEEKKEWLQKQNSEVNKLEHDFKEMSTQFSSEIIQGRQWVEEERRKISVERQAFQVEQMLILEWIEKKKDELEVMRSDLLAKEHDVIVRVLNEKALIEEERHEFERRKSADVIRIREEANQLDSSLKQVENARNALLQAKEEFTGKIEQLNGIKEMLLEYERAYWKEGRAMRKKY